MLQNSFEVQVLGRLGSGARDTRKICILNRIVRYTGAGFEWESDPRHADFILQQMDLASASSLSSPGTKDRDRDPGEEDLQGEEATAYRAVAARGNFLAMDRADVQYSAKEVCRTMAVPGVVIG
eukprot:15437608-Heterocapsa_arctica.AAC.1